MRLGRLHAHDMETITRYIWTWWTDTSLRTPDAWMRHFYSSSTQASRPYGRCWGGNLPMKVAITGRAGGPKHWGWCLAFS